MTGLTSFKARGFSLIEMIVALGLVAIMSGIGLSTTVRSSEQKKITESAETVRQYFFQAKSLAMAGRKDCLACGAAGGVCGNGDSPLFGWRTTLTSGSPVRFELHGECGATSFFSSGQKSLPDSIVLTLTGPGNVVFYPLDRGTSLNNTTTIRFSSVKPGLTAKTFTITPNGEISAVY